MVGVSPSRVSRDQVRQASLLDVTSEHAFRGRRSADITHAYEQNIDSRAVRLYRDVLRDLQLDKARELSGSINPFVYQQHLFKHPGYRALLGAFGANLLFKTGSRPVKRQGDHA